MRLFFARYVLHPIKKLNAVSEGAARDGALLKLELPDGTCGYADLHPWPELGDENVSKQLEALKAERPTALTAQSLWMANRDAKARAQKTSLARTDVQIPNNFLLADLASLTPALLDEIAGKGYRCLKLKCGRDVKVESRAVNLLADRGGFRLRLDFNGRGTRESLIQFLERVKPESDSFIDYVEDPASYDAELWKFLRRRWKLGLDHEVLRAPWSLQEAPEADVLILKPARQNVEENVKIAFHWGMPVTVTSSMDHPVGVMHAYVIAQELKKTHGEKILTAGCLTTQLYHQDLFSKDVKTEGPYLLPAKGFGIGFDQALAETTWQPISSL
jgi:O-succinylbenzoate synthase